MKHDDLPDHPARQLLSFGGMYKSTAPGTKDEPFYIWSTRSNGVFWGATPKEVLDDFYNDYIAKKMST